MQPKQQSQNQQPTTPSQEDTVSQLQTPKAVESPEAQHPVPQPPTVEQNQSQPVNVPATNNANGADLITLQ